MIQDGKTDVPWIDVLLSPEERQQFHALIERFTDVFSQSKFDIGRVATDPDGAAELSGWGNSAAISLKAGTPSTLPALAGGILLPQFLTNAGLAGWTETDALKALPAVLDDNALAAVLTIPPSGRSTLTQMFDKMAAVFAPPLNTR
ncbi:unnamed protein product [Lampetra fluviatilis]